MIVNVEKGISRILKAERSDMPVMIPGNAIGRMTSSEMASRPKKRALETAAAHSVPRTMEIAVEAEATRSERPSASHTSGRFHVTASQWSVRPGGGNT